MKRVCIIGCPGSGKSTFSRKLAKKTKLPLIHLDMYYHDKNKDYYSANNKKAWLTKIEQLTKQECWIIDGNYSSSFTLRFTAADTIIFLDYPRWLVLKRLLTRRWHFRSGSGRKRQDMPDDWEESIDWSFFWFVWRFRKKYRERINKALNATNTHHKLLLFTMPKELDKFLVALDEQI